MGKTLGRPPKILDNLVAKIKRDWIEDKKPGSRLPTEAKLSEQYDISRTTVRGAIDFLELNRFVYRIVSKGAYVSGDYGESYKKLEGQQIALVCCKPHYFYPFTDDFWIKVTFGIQNEIHKFGVNLLQVFRPLQFFRKKKHTLLKNITHDSVSGVCVLGPQPDEVWSSLEDCPVPVMALDINGVSKGVDSFCFNNAGAASILARRLKKFGHENIAVVHESHDKPENRKDSAWTERSEGIIKEWKKINSGSLYSLPINQRRNLFGQIQKPFQEFLALPRRERPTALVLPCSVDEEDLVAELNKIGMEIPRQLSLVGYASKSIFNSQNNTNLSGFVFDPMEMGKQAALRIFHLVRSNRKRPVQPTLTLLKGVYQRGSTLDSMG